MEVRNQLARAIKSALYYSSVKFQVKGFGKYSLTRLLLLTGFNASSVFATTKAEAYAARQTALAMALWFMRPAALTTSFAKVLRLFFLLSAIPLSSQPAFGTPFSNAYFATIDLAYAACEADLPYVKQALEKYWGVGVAYNFQCLEDPNKDIELTWCLYGDCVRSAGEYFYPSTSCPTGQSRLTVPPYACKATNTLTPLKNTANPSEGLCTGNPINIGTGNKFQLESDYQGADDFPLIFARSYNSDPSAVSASFSAGSGWRHSYERSITRSANSSLATAYREDGRAYDFTLTGTRWSPAADFNLQLGATASGGN